MYSLDITLKFNPTRISIFRKDADSAHTLYAEVREVMKGSESTLLELTCEKDEDKQIALLSDQISAIALNKKSGAAVEGRVPGFFASQTAAE